MRARSRPTRRLPGSPKSGPRSRSTGPLPQPRTAARTATITVGRSGFTRASRPRRTSRPRSRRSAPTRRQRLRWLGSVTGPTSSSPTRTIRTSGSAATREAGAPGSAAAPMTALALPTLARIRASVGAACVFAGSAAAADAQAPSGRIPLGTGATIVQTLSAVGADRESVHSVRLASDSGLHYEWRLEEVHDNGDTLRQELRYLEAWTDLADARRLRIFHDPKAPEAHPGYTMHALSRATYRRVREGKPDSFQVMSVDQSPASGPLSSFGFGGGRPTPVRWRGT